MPGRPVERRQFWRIPPYEPRIETLDQAAERLRGVLEESVALHAFADAPVGAFLSGGVDSTGVVGLMRKHVPDLRTYTLRFPDVPHADESEFAIATAKAFGCRNTVVEVSGNEMTQPLARVCSGDGSAVDRRAEHVAHFAGGRSGCQGCALRAGGRRMVCRLSGRSTDDLLLRRIRSAV